MQIRNEYTSFQNRSYQEGHTHHITECLQDDPVKKKEGASGSLQSAFEVQNKSVEFSKDGDIYQMNAGNAKEEIAGKKSGLNLMKDFWDALGDEGAQESKNPLAVMKDHLLSGIYGAATSIKNTLQYQVVERVQSVPVKVKEVLRNAKTALGQRQDAFTALTDGHGPSGRGNSDTSKRGKDGQVTSAGKEEDIPMKVLKHSHLMDSYSRQGEYCQLNDNLTYGNVKNNRRTQKKEDQ